MLFPWQRFCLLLLLLLPLLAFSTNAHADSNNVLILHSYHHGFPWTDSIDRGMRSALQNQATNPLIFTEYLDTKRFAPQQRFAELLPYFKRKYARQTFKIILTSDDNAFSFALKNRAQLFPNATIVFCGVNNLAAHDYTRAGNLTGVVEAYDVEGTMRLALKLFPKTRTLALVSDSTPTGEMNLQGALAAQSILGNKVQFLPLSNLSVSKLKAALQNLPPDSLVFNLGFWRDCEQELLTNQQSMQLLVQSSPVPVFALWDFLIGEGTFGGLVVNGETQGATAGALASRLLNGVAVSKLPIIMTSPNTPMFDHQALMRFGLSVRKLPTGSRLINPPDSLLDRYQNFVWPTIGLLAIETLLIALLLLNFIWRRRSEQRLETSEADFKKLIEASPIPLRVSEVRLSMSISNSERCSATPPRIYRTCPAGSKRPIQTQNIARRLSYSGMRRSRKTHALAPPLSPAKGGSAVKTAASARSPSAIPSSRSWESQPCSMSLNAIRYCANVKSWSRRFSRLRRWRVSVS